MDGILFRPDVWQGKLRAIDSLGYAVTRRLSGLEEINKEPSEWEFKTVGVLNPANNYLFRKRDGEAKVVHPRFREGQVVYRKEAWATEAQYDHLAPRNIPQTATIHYMSDGVGEWPLNLQIGKPRSPMFLREYHARYFLRILELRHERLQEITIADAIAEGCRAGIVYPNKWPADKGSARDDFAALWDVINPQHPWAGNWWVGRYRFELWSKPE